MQIWTSPTDLTEDTYYDTREKMKASLCPTLIKLAPCIDVHFSLKLETDWKPDLLCREKNWAELEVLLPLLEGRAEETSPFSRYSFHQLRSPENCRAFLLLSGKWFSSNSILSCWGSASLSSLTLPASSLLSAGLHPHAGCWRRYHLPTWRHTLTCCP